MIGHARWRLGNCISTICQGSDDLRRANETHSDETRICDWICKPGCERLFTMRLHDSSGRRSTELESDQSIAMTGIKLG